MMGKVVVVVGINEGPARARGLNNWCKVDDEVVGWFCLLGWDGD